MRICTVATENRLDLGSAVELRKWERYYASFGHDIYRIRGDIKEGATGANVVRCELDPGSPENIRMMRIALGYDADRNPADATQLAQAPAEIVYDVLERAVRTHGCDAFHVDGFLSYPFSLPLLFAMRKLLEEHDVKILGRDHDFIWDTRLSFAEYYEQELSDVLPLEHPNVLHAPLTEWAASRLREKKPGIQHHTIPNLFDFNFDRSLHHPSFFRSQNGIPKNEILIFHPTRFVPAKGMHHTVHLAGALQKALGIPVHVIISGRTTARVGRPHPSGRYRAAVESLAARLGVSIHGCLGTLLDYTQGPHSEMCIGCGYAAADLVSFPAMNEGFGNPLMESVAFQVPIFTSSYSVLINEFLPQGLRFPLIDPDPFWSVNEDGWDFDVDQMRIPESVVEEFCEEFSAKSCGVSSSLARNLKRNHEIARDIYADSSRNRELYFRPVVSWLESDLL